MKNFLSHGHTLTFTNGSGSDLASGAGHLQGAIFGVCADAVANGAEGTLNLTGTYELPKAASQAWAVGAKIYWDGSEATTVDTDNTLIGVAAAAVGSGATEILGAVRLNGTAA
ncbi:DUF2190 family protein [Aliiruegeria sabulilitoris]|uniref:DUF2190 family protein n=1 Tax=Aliiruegeria sabulilitoris TaxID=1510458 RepID=UPI0008321863|nr:DUF2190 family protein [Aliiruegeria sabulilitoris]NDR57129.1 DUF2190 family protein [Pseudoruegeria sp. M32A2M]